MRQSKYERIIAISFGLSAIPLLLMGIILMFKRDTDIWTVPAILGFIACAGFLHWDARYERAVRAEAEERSE